MTAKLKISFHLQMILFLVLPVIYSIKIKIVFKYKLLKKSHFLGYYIFIMPVFISFPEERNLCLSI